MTIEPARWKIGAVSYLNTLPLVHGLAQHGEECSLVFDLPSRLADQLASGDLDVALIPSIEALQNSDYTIVSNACIACRGPVWSVKLMSRVPLDSIRTLALDEGSRTSIALVRLLLERQYSNRPELISLPIDANWQETGADAVLIIGDRAMNPDHTEQFPLAVDLGNWWHQQTGLPFVFAMWTARAGISAVDLSRIDQLLSDSRDLGVARAADIAKANASDYGLTLQQGLDYFQKFLHFTLGTDEREALSRFGELASELNLAPETLQLHYHDC